MVAGLESSLWYSIAATVVSLLLGGGLAVAERLWQQPVRRWFMSVMLLPVFLPPVIVSTSFIVLPLPLYTPWAVILAFCYYNVPLAYVLLRTAISRISIATETASQIMGANRWQRFVTGLLPQLRLPLLGTAGVIWLYCFTSFILPLQLGGIRGQTLEVWLYQQIYVYHHYNTALLAALIQFSIIGCVLMMIFRLVPNITLTKITPEQFVRSRTQFTIIRILFGVMISLPLLGLIWKLISSVTLPDVTTLLQSGFIPALVRTGAIMVVILLVSISLVLIGRFGTKTAVVFLTLSPVTISFIWYQVFGKGYISLIGALVMLLLPITALLIDQARTQYSHYVLSTARLLGANWWQRLQLEFNLLKPSLRQTLVFGSILVIGDATISPQLTPTAQPLAMPYALQLISSYRFPVGSLALLCILLVISGIVTLQYARRS